MQSTHAHNYVSYKGRWNHLKETKKYIYSLDLPTSYLEALPTYQQNNRNFFLVIGKGDAYGYRSSGTQSFGIQLSRFVPSQLSRFVPKLIKYVFHVKYDKSKVGFLL